MSLHPHRHGGADPARLRGPAAGAGQAAEVRRAPAEGRDRVRLLHAGLDLHQVQQPLSLYYLFFLPIFALNVNNALNHMVHITRSAVSRCYLFPTRVLYSTLHAAEEYIDMFPAYYIFNTLLISLQFLNVVWTVQILRVRSLEGYSRAIVAAFSIIIIATIFVLDGSGGPAEG